MTTSHPLISREELKKLERHLVDSTKRIEEILHRLEEFSATEVISELSEVDQHAFTCVSIITTRILDDVKTQFKGKRKSK